MGLTFNFIFIDGNQVSMGCRGRVRLAGWGRWCASYSHSNCLLFAARAPAADSAHHNFAMQSPNNAVAKQRAFGDFFGGSLFGNGFFGNLLAGQFLGLR